MGRNDERDNAIVGLHLQGYKGAEIARLPWANLTRERVRQIVNASGLRLDRRTFLAVRDQRLFPQETIECGCGCGGTLDRYKYYYGKAHQVAERKFIYGHRPPCAPYEMTEAIRRKLSDAKKRSWAEGAYDNRKPGAREVANGLKVARFVRENPGCSLSAVIRGTGMRYISAIHHIRNLCVMEKVDCGWHWRYSLTLREE